MRDILEGMLAESGTLTTEEILMHIFAALVLGMFIYISYYISHAGTAYSRKFNISLVCLTVLTATVMTVIGNNLSLSLGMVGALSIVRFRTAVKDTRDTIYIFWTIVVGICCGVADYLVACAGSAVIFVILLFLGHVKNENRILLIVKGSWMYEDQIEKEIFDYFSRKALLRTKNTTPTTVEYIYELSRKMLNESSRSGTSITSALYEIPDTQYVDIVAQSDEISG